MSTENTQPPYFQTQQDNLKPKSKKKSYKYTDQQFTLQPSVTQRYRVKDSKYNVNDFSFEDRSKRIHTPKIQNKQQAKNEGQPSPIVEKEGSNNKKFDQRINKIQNLNDKISSLLKMVPKNNQIQYKTSLRNYAPQIVPQEKPENTPRTKQAEFKAPVHTPYRRIQEITNKIRKTDERKKNYSYLDQVDNRVADKQPEEQQTTKTYFNAKYQTRQSPIRKYHIRPQQNQQQSQPYKIQEYSSAVKVDKIGGRGERTVEIDYRYQNPRIGSKYKQMEEQKIQKENKQEDRRQKVVKSNNELDNRINQIKNKIFDSPIQNKPYHEQTTQYYQSENEVQQPTVAQLANKLSKLIDIDIILRKIRQSFQQYRSDKKWDALRTQLKSKNIYIEEKQLKQILKISIHEKNPFGDKIEAFPLNGVKDLAKIFAEGEAVWNIQLDKVVSLDSLAAERFEMAFIDINRKGYITIEDLVCFVNVHSQKFYRSRDVAQLFRRFLEIEGKKLQKNIGEGISYACFMNKVTR